MGGWRWNMRKSLLVSAFVVFAAIACPAYALSYGGRYVWEAEGSYAGASLDFGVSLDIGYCYNYLAAYGSWVSMAPYGYVWYPRQMGYRWRPYSEGHWVWTDYGWTWISDEDWGWIPFHYGRWGWDDDAGWFWVPGTTWGPAWVSWRYNDQYCGWAPLPPGAEFRAGMDFRSLSISIPGRFWVFVETPHFLDRDIRSRALPYERNATIISYTSVHNNTYLRDNRIINEGIGVDEVRRFTKRDVPRYSLRDAGQPGPARVSGHEVQIYRPAFRENPAVKPDVVLSGDNARRELAPAKVFEPRQQAQSPQGKAEVTRRQAEEKSLLQKTQSQELKELQRKQSAEMKSAQSRAEKAKVKRDYQSRVSELQKSHQAEKQQMAQRHQRDTEQLRGAQPAKQGRPPEQARKGKQEEKSSLARNSDHRQ
jgi:hypothetical protein